MLWPRPIVLAMRRIAPDVVHSHSGVWHKASLGARQAGVRRIIHTEHGIPQSDSLLARLVLRWATRRTNVVVAVSDELSQVLAGLLGKGATIRTLRNGVDTGRFLPRADTGEVRRELGIPMNSPMIGSIGRLEPVKAYDLMIEAIARLRAIWSDGPLPVLVVAGDGSERQRLEALAAERGATGAVRLLGWRDDIDALHSAFTIFSLSSRSEGTSVSLLESMSAGLCPVVTDVGGNATVLGPDLRHCLVAPGDPLALATAWRAALTDDIRRQADAAAARRRIESEFSVEAMVRGYERLYLDNPSA
jgi:glycosyltransferase involved in cell wall biosynthesis